MSLCCPTFSGLQGPPFYVTPVRPDMLNMHAIAQIRLWNSLILFTAGKCSSTICEQIKMAYVVEEKIDCIILLTVGVFMYS